jgi:uncharacterized protein (DUF4415 family)
MSKQKLFPFEKARRITPEEVSSAKKAIESFSGKKRKLRGRPQKGENKFKPISIRLHPVVIEWAKKEAKRRGVGYQTVINEELLKIAA